MPVQLRVAPARERGLKCEKRRHYGLLILRRSRKGAWIEMYMAKLKALAEIGRSCKGAWIEINLRFLNPVLPTVAPVRERGLKCQQERML